MYSRIQNKILTFFIKKVKFICLLILLEITHISKRHRTRQGGAFLLTFSEKKNKIKL